MPDKNRPQKRVRDYLRAQYDDNQKRMANVLSGCANILGVAAEACQPLDVDNVMNTEGGPTAGAVAIPFEDDAMKAVCDLACKRARWKQEPRAITNYAHNDRSYNQHGGANGRGKERQGHDKYRDHHRGHKYYPKGNEDHRDRNHDRGGRDYYTPPAKDRHGKPYEPPWTKQRSYSSYPQRSSSSSSQLMPSRSRSVYPQRSSSSHSQPMPRQAKSVAPERKRKDPRPNSPTPSRTKRHCPEFKLTPAPRGGHDRAEDSTEPKQVEKKEKEDAVTSPTSEVISSSSSDDSEEEANKEEKGKEY